MAQEFSTILWICIGMFAIASLLTPLALLGRVKLGRTNKNHDRYTRTLFYTIVVGASGACVSYFGARLKGENIVAPLVSARIVDITPQITNFSSRQEITTDVPIIFGFVVSGTGDRRILVRAVGPGLSDLGISSALKDPTIELLMLKHSDHNGAQADKVSQISIESEATGEELQNIAMMCGAFPGNPSEDASIVATLKPGVYTVAIRSKSKNTGTFLFELYNVR